MTEKKIPNVHDLQSTKVTKTDNHIVAELRENFGKGYARRLRMQGRIPAVIFGHGSKPQHVSLPAHEVGLLLRKANALIDLTVEGKKQLVLVKDVQKDPVRQIIEHLDLVTIKKGEKVQVEVPIHIEGVSFSGTIVLIEENTIRVEADATHIPERIIIEVEGAEEGTRIHASDAPLPEGSSLLDDPELLLVQVIVPAAADLGTPVEPEEGEEGEDGESAEGDAAEGDAAEGDADASAE